MKTEILLKIKQNPVQLKFLREYSEWYKLLNRNYSNYEKMLSDMKVKYKMRFVDKVNNVADSVDLISKFVSIAND